MSSTTKNAKHLSIILVVTLLTLNLPCVTLVNVAHAAPGKTPKSIKAEKVSSLLKSNTHTPDERITVIVTLSGPINYS